ncbi:MAG: hypothetical protein EZS28_046575, partial [Streblomastix strix]
NMEEIHKILRQYEKWEEQYKKQTQQNLKETKQEQDGEENEETGELELVYRPNYLDNVSYGGLCKCLLLCFIILLMSSSLAIYVFRNKNVFHANFVSPQTNYYQILGLEPTATSKEIRDAYKQLARKYHPDKHKQCKECPEIFNKVTDAYEHLKSGFSVLDFM